MSKSFWITNEADLFMDVFVVLGDVRYFVKQLQDRFAFSAEEAKALPLDANGEPFDGIFVRLENRGGKFGLIWVADQIWTTRWYGTLVHEVAHLVDRLFESRDVPPGPDSTELRASVTDFYFTAILNRARNRKTERSGEKQYEIKRRKRK